MTTVTILGGGFMGQIHAAAYASLDGRARVKTVCSRTEEKAARVAETVGAEPLTDLAAAIDDPEVDVVDVCLPTALHREAVERAFAAGKHVLLEKPIALTAEDADAIIAARDRSGRFLMVGLVLRFWAEYVELQRRVAAGELGPPLAASTARLSPPADWNRWMRDAALSGGVAVDLLVHDFDQLNGLFGTPRRVFARAASDDQHVLSIVEYERGEATAEGSMAMPGSYPFSSNIRVLCEGGVAEYAFTAAPAEGEGNIGGVDPAARGLRLYPSDGEPETVVVEAGDPWAAQISHFLDCVESGSTPEQATGEQAREALRVSLAANRSLESGRAETV